MEAKGGRKRKQFRKRRHSSSSDEGSDGEDTSVMKSILTETKEIQSLRRRPHGVNAVGLALGKTYTQEDEMTTNDPFKMKTGGIIDMKTLKKSQVEAEEEETIGTTFAAETNRRDEDADMLKYVEEEMAKKKGIDKNKIEEKKLNAADALYDLPEHLNISSKKKTEDMLSNQMLSGIPEVDLGIDAKIRNIEATEEAKRLLLLEKMNKKRDSKLDFVPTNMAVNFVQHNRFNIEEHVPKVKKAEPAPKPAPLRVGDVERPSTLMESDSKPRSSTHHGKGEKATDDFHFEKFRKQIRRY